jgi:hypothetical protein
MLKENSEYKSNGIFFKILPKIITNEHDRIIEKYLYPSFDKFGKIILLMKLLGRDNTSLVDRRG